jgi:hypothetical protein
MYYSVLSFYFPNLDQDHDLDQDPDPDFDELDQALDPDQEIDQDHDLDQDPHPDHDNDPPNILQRLIIFSKN